MTPREIKFRAYSNLSMSGSPKMIYLDLATCAGKDLVSVPGWIVMQSTGLLDKNGKEIYEGDILRYKNTESGSTSKHQVLFQETKARFAIKAISGPDKDKNPAPFVHRRANWDSLPFEVIGDIYSTLTS